MKLKKLFAMAGVTAVVATGLALVTAGGAEAHDQKLTADCQTGVQVSLLYYHDIIPAKDAVYKDVKVIDVAAQPAVPAVYKDVKVIDKAAVPAVPAVTHVEYQFLQVHNLKTRWETNPDWNANNNPESTGWIKTGITRTITDKAAIPAQPEVSHIEKQLVTPAKDAVAEVSHIEKQLVTPAKDAQANHAKLTDNGAVLLDKDFGTTLNASFPNSDKTIAHDYVLTVISNDGIGAGTWTKHVNACEVPVTPVTGTPVVTITGPTCDAPWNILSYDIPKGLSINGFTGKGTLKVEDYPGSFKYGVVSTENVTVEKGYSYDGPKTVTFGPAIDPGSLDCRKTVEAKTAAEIVATCGVADVTITNPQAENEINKTGAGTVWIDGKFQEAFSVAANETVKLHYSFPEDSGDHTIVVKDAEFAGGKTLAEITVHSDCLPAEDATAAVIVAAPTCDKDGAAKVDAQGTVNATLDGKLDQTPGTHTAVFRSDEGHAFKGGKTWLEVEYTVKAKTGNCPTTTPTPGPTSTPAAGAPAKPLTGAPKAVAVNELAHTGANGPYDQIGAIGGSIIALGLICAIGAGMTGRRREAKAAQK